MSRPMCQARQVTSRCAVLMAALAISVWAPAKATATPALAPGDAGPADRAAQDTVPFLHDDHRDLDCLVCHRSGAPTVRRQEGWCADCHHSAERSVTCAGCHGRRELRGRAYPVTRSLRMSVGDVEGRRFSFRHGDHESLTCGRCHRRRPSLSAAGLDCVQCHERHHRADAVCTSCHVSAGEATHPRRVHLTCQGSGCHDPARVPETGRTRNACTVCHQEMSDHKAGRSCVECHVMPTSEAARAEGGGS